MVLSIDQLEPVIKEFEQKYFFSKPYCEYVNFCSVSNLRMMQDIKKKKVDLRADESLEDLCLFVEFRKDPPASLDFPPKYRGIRIFYEISGE